MLCLKSKIIALFLSLFFLSVFAQFAAACCVANDAGSVTYCCDVDCPSDSGFTRATSSDKCCKSASGSCTPKNYDSSARSRYNSIQSSRVASGGSGGGGASGGADEPGDLEIPNPLGADTGIEDIIDSLISFFLVVALIVCPLMIVVGGFFFITSAGDPAKANKGRGIMIYAAVGLVIILISKGLVTAVRTAVGVSE